VHAGVLRTRQGDGTYVAVLEPSRMLDGVALYSSLATGARLEQVLDARRIIEPELTALAAVRIEPEDVAKLYGYIDIMAAATAETFPVATDVEFHRLIARSSGNDLLARILDALTPITVRPRQWRAVVDSGSLAGQIHQHRAIADAVRAHDPDAARAAALLHVADVVRFFREHPEAPDDDERLPDAQADA
jgi:DNA-binding FadR family transcriptional regulator